MNVGEQLPWIARLTDDRGRPLDWRDARRNRVVFFGHPGECAACSRHAGDLTGVRDRLARSDADLWLVGRVADAPAPAAASDVVRVTGDADRRLRDRCGLSADDARLVVADRWGQIWQTATAGDRHLLTDPAEVVETANFIAIQCPECETPDQPAGDWSSVR